MIHLSEFKFLAEEFGALVLVFEELALFKEFPELSQLLFQLPDPSFLINLLLEPLLLRYVKNFLTHWSQGILRRRLRSESLILPILHCAALSRLPILGISHTLLNSRAHLLIQIQLSISVFLTRTTLNIHRILVRII